MGESGQLSSEPRPFRSHIWGIGGVMRAWGPIFAGFVHPRPGEYFQAAPLNPPHAPVPCEVPDCPVRDLLGFGAPSVRRDERGRWCCALVGDDGEHRQTLLVNDGPPPAAAEQVGA
jgi:hypothetical protein